MTTVLAFIAALALLIVVHEWGHYRIARACGVKVLRFSVGFGKPLWRYQRTPDSTEFVLGVLPLGGYVRMLDEREAAVPADQQHLAFNRKPVGQRALIVAAGPIANLLLAVALYAAAALTGIQEPRAVISQPTPGSVAEKAGLRSGDWVREVAIVSSGGHSAADSAWQEVRSYTELRWVLMRAALNGSRVDFKVTQSEDSGPRTSRMAGSMDLSAFDPKLVDHGLFSHLGLTGLYTEPVIGVVQPGEAADRAGLRTGDRVLSIAGQPTPDGRSVIDAVRSAGRDTGGVRQTWMVERDAQRLTVEVVPQVSTQNGVSVGRIGAYVGAPPVTDTIQMGLVPALLHGAQQTWEASSLTLRVLAKMLVGQASLKNLSGPVTIAEAAGRSVEAGIAPYLVFLALVSVSLGVLNLLPLPVLDGGHLMYYLWEVIRGKPPTDAWMHRLQQVGLVAIVLMMSLALFNDVSRLAGL